MLRRASLFLFFLAACGGGSKPAATTAAVTTPAPASKQSIDAFHEVIAPLWHAPESPERTEKTCAAVPTMESKAQEIGDALLVESIHALGAECEAGRADFQAKFSTVHDAFHAAMEKSGVGHDESHAH